MCDRINRYGKWTGKVGENISCGQSDARDVVVQLIIDDSLRSTTHRDDILDPESEMAGVSCREHCSATLPSH